MKRVAAILLIFGSIILISSCASDKDKKGGDKEVNDKLPVLTLLDSASYDFGTIAEGAVVEHTFRFRNDGEYPLILNNITSSCGCTTPEWPREPIEAKATGSIKVRFDSKNKSGPQVKTITVYANTEPAYSELRLRGIVNAAPKPEAKK
ncbi:hypothetical protein DYBT9275_03269 [Dyadobacter sp. CECT 9275]|uniref:DUF1573 domain-containing protein n=1 Tax=Dyadobacter helix TaxID=2822344 RepID=A0A916JD52_9BACT|nr:DUF1573 domain-containing protein [Dyadobacter sp. CECT 9275]CAG5003968.1 hypothetical protein DYBT9275_03269 [Dyadobacter sp. CECT 9275]